jgi:hypothetical protein
MTMKKKDNHATDADVPKQNGKPRWKSKFDEYRTDEVAVLTFGTKKDLHAAIDLVWVGTLQGMPFGVVTDGESMAVPRQGIPYFTKAGIRFVEKLFAAST